MTEFTPVADFDSIALNHSRIVQFQDRTVALFNDAGTIYAIDNECPHKGAPLGGGSIEDGKVYCPLHGWDFELSTGRCGVNLEQPVTVYPVKIENGKIHLAKPTPQD